MPRYPLNKSEVLYFMHIPKTAGTTLERVLEAQFPTEKVCPHSLIHELILASPDELDRYQLIMGHHFYPIEQLINRKPICITLVRHPLDWAMSYYSHVQREPTHHHYHLAESKSLLEFLQDPATQAEIQNYQTCYIAASPDLKAIEREIRLVAENDPQAQVAVIAEMNWNIYEPSMLDIAMQRLDECAFVGITEQVDTAVLILCHLFGWKPPEAVHALNVSPNRPEIDEKTEKLLTELMAVDLQLYEYAYARHEAATKETIKDLFPTIDSIKMEKQNLLSIHEAAVAENEAASESINAQQQKLDRIAEIEDS